MAGIEIKTRFPVRLQNAIDDCFKNTVNVRENRKQIVDRYASGFFSPRYSTKSRPINMVWRYINLMMSFLYSQPHKTMVEPKADVKLTGFAKISEMAINHLKKEIHTYKKMRRIVHDGLTSMGIAKIGMAPWGSVEIGGSTFQSGQPYLEPVDFDDFFWDISSRSEDDMRFYGNRYRLPIEYIQSSGLYMNYDKIQRCSAMFGSNTSVDRLSKEGMGDPEYHELVEYAEVYDVWLPDEQLLVTLPAKGQGEKYIRVVDEFPEEGPYEFLSFFSIPGSPIPVPPAYSIMDLDDSLNRLVRRVQISMEKQKTILAYDGNGAKDADRVVNANDGDAVHVDNVDRLKEVTFGGVKEQALAYAQWLRDHTSEQGGNLDALGGIRTEAGTLGQEQMLVGNASKILDDMVNTMHVFLGNVDRKLAWYLWSDPLIKIPMIRELGGNLGKIKVEYSEETKEGDFYDYNFDVIPHSMQLTNSEQGYNQLLKLMSQIVLPLAPLAAQTGLALNPEEVVKLAVRYLDVPSLEKVWQAAEPMFANPGPYQPSQGSAKPKSGQIDGRLGGGDQSANLFQQQARAGGESSKNFSK